MTRNLKPFDAMTVPLQDSNLIEASAGTGKTYSIAILVLRLIVEKKLPLKEVLMVTFTKAAVAELEERIRLFIRSAYKVSLGESIDDKTITALVTGSKNQEETRNLLKNAVLFLDETSVLTIHSFCQQTLNEYAFETNQLFGAETLNDIGTLIDEGIKKFWRKEITGIPTELLRHLLEAGVSRNSLKEIVTAHLGGKKYFSFDAEKTYELKNEDHPKLLKELAELRGQREDLENCLIQHVKDNEGRLKTISSNGLAKKHVYNLIEDPHGFVRALSAKRGSAYIQKLYPDIIDQIVGCEDMLETMRLKVYEVIDRVTCMCIHSVSMHILDYKQRNNQMSFDDMILKLHEALHGKNSSRLITELQKKYKAIFVDEFQDTDKLQYEIFEKAFTGIYLFDQPVLFYIGDPKQSIFAWRKADIFTYFKAQDQVDKLYSMNQNFRSSAPMIKAMNRFFLPVAGFDTFHFNGEEHAITYTEVESPAENKKGVMLDGKKTSVPISITALPNNADICKAVAAQVIELLENKEHKIPSSDGNYRTIRPSDIGVLVKSHQQGRDIKNSLANFGIPSVTIGEAKVLQSTEATFLLYLLEAMNSISRATINKALLSPFTGFGVNEILKLDDENTLNLFRKYKLRWEEDGIYTALVDFVSDFNVQQVLLENNLQHGERIITNLFHLIELVHKIQTSKILSPLELISWLKRSIEGMESEGDEYIQRVENDEDAVKIATIHSSKGLEYKIVIAPFMDFVEKKNEKIYSFRDEDSGEYVAVESSLMTPEQRSVYSKQTEQEFRRLLYVAVTRAIYKCFIFKNTYHKKSTLSYFTNAIGNSYPDFIEWPTPLIAQEGYRYSKTESWKPLRIIKDVNFSLSAQNWTRMSYTMLAAKHEQRKIAAGSKHDDAYEHFIFNQLSRGDKTGNLLHLIFEKINYTNNEGWISIIDSAIKRFAPNQKKLYSKLLNRLIENVLGVQVNSNGSTFSLQDIDYNKRIHELEFDFPVNAFQPSILDSLSDEKIQVNVKSLSSLEGIMNGKIDLFFEHDGKYYILDWKSNYLGDNLEDYSADALVTAMNEANYHLQYLIYTLAVKKYLASRLASFDYERDFGGVIYVFIRGVRNNSNSGIFITKPSVEKIKFLEQICLQQSLFSAM